MAHQHHLAVMFALVATMPFGATTKLKFAILPGTCDLKDTMISTADVGAAASSAQECVDLVVAAEPTALAISFDNSTGACKYSTSIYSYYPRGAGQQPAFYLRADTTMKDPSASGCLTEQDAEYLIASLSFGDEQCVTPAIYDSVSRLCAASTTLPYNLGRYMAGRTREDEQDTFYTLSRGLALESVKFECAWVPSTKMIFGGTWYCYYGPNVQVSVSTITSGTCAEITEKRELGFWYNWRNGIVYIGLYLKDGTTYVWYDGSAATDLPWAVGRPLGDPANDLVYVDADLTVADGNDSGADGLFCKAAASNIGYNSTAKFA